MKKFTLFFILIFSFFGCGEETPVQSSELTFSTSQKIDSIELSEHNRLMAEQNSLLVELEKKFEQLVTESDLRAAEDAKIINELEAQILSLNNSLDEYRSEISESRNSLKEIKKIGSKEYQIIYERSKNLDHEQAILLYEEFLNEFPNSPVSSRARSRIKFHQTEIKILDNRKSSRPLNLWEAKVKGEGMFSRAVKEEEIFQLVGRRPDSTKRGSSSEYRQRIYVWRDSVIDGGYHDLIIETTDGKVDRISRSE